MIEQDPEIQFCINGRDLSQITGEEGAKTKGRFPNLLTQVKMQIAVAALRQAQDNYNEKLNTAVAEASKDASVDLAQYMCQMLPHTNGSTLGSTEVDTPLTIPYAISYEVGAGLSTAALSQGGGRVQSQNSEKAILDAAGGTSGGAYGTAGAIAAGGAAISDAANAAKGIIGATKGIASSASSAMPTVAIANAAAQAIGALASDRVHIELPSGTREMWALFSRETRTCHYCTSTITKNCKSVRKKGFLGIGNKSSLECTEAPPVENCQDIQM